MNPKARILQPLFLLALGALVGCDASRQSQADKSTSTVDSFFSNSSAAGRVEAFAEAAKGKALRGRLADSSKDWAKGRYEGEPCEIRFLTGEDSPWANGAPHYEFVLIRPLDKDKAEQDPVWGSQLDLKEIDYASSNEDKMHRYKNRKTGLEHIRTWTRSGLFIAPRTGFLDLDLDTQGRLVSASHGGFQAPNKETVLGRCVLEDPLSL